MGSISDIDISLPNIWRSWQRFRVGKKTSIEILRFEQHLPENILRICADLNNGSYEHSGYKHKIVKEKKRRDIAVANVRDRIVHRLLYDHLVSAYNSTFDYDVWSCRVDKGTVAALERTQRLLAKYPDSFVWRGDIQKFFDNVDHQVLRELLQRYKLGRKAYNLLDKIIVSYTSQLDGKNKAILVSSFRSRGVGLPIGNLTSQVLANVFLHEFDHFVRHILKPLAYIRYGDDFVLIAKTKVDAEYVQTHGAEFLLLQLHLTIHKHNNVIVPIKSGVKFLGVTTFPKSTVLPRKSIARIKKNLSDVNSDSYTVYVNRYASSKQKAVIDEIKREQGE